MTEKSENFEQEIARIHELLEGSKATVEWNGKVIDPDNRGKKRQIDVLIRTGNLTTFLECRIHKDKQNVKWIEELIGRRVSLQADCIIGVSSSGFTSGATKKAEKFGILLRDLKDLSDSEIQSWADSIEVNLFFYKYLDFKVTLHLESGDFKNFDIVKLGSELQMHPAFRSIINAPQTVLDDQKPMVEENRNKTWNFDVRIGIENFTLQNKKVNEVQIEGRAQLEKRELEIPMVVAYGNPGSPNSSRDVYVQKYNLGQTEIIHHENSISMLLDISNLDLPPYHQFGYFEVKSKSLKNYESLELKGAEKLIMKIDRLSLAVIGLSENVLGVE